MFLNHVTINNVQWANEESEFSNAKSSKTLSIINAFGHEWENNSNKTQIPNYIGYYIYNSRVWWIETIFLRLVTIKNKNE